jgi:uncharacterized protein (DUF169 family)
MRDQLATIDQDLRDLLGLSVSPIAITFADTDPSKVAPFGETYPTPLPDGRTGAVPAGCAFWIHATNREFKTTAADHANCSVGSVTHGFKSLQDVIGNSDVEALLAAQWVTPEAASQIPAVAQTPAAVVYGPLNNTSVDPDVVFLRINGKQLMLLNDAWPELRLEGKPQCHIIPIAKESGEIVVSSGCMLSRVRTGMSNNEVTCAIPANRVGELVDRLKVAREADNKVAAYAASDAKRFS